jgi:hypothetical protein
MIKVYLLIFAVSLLVLTGCYTNQAGPVTPVRDYGFDLVKIPFDSLYQHSGKLSKAYESTTVDSNGAPMFLWNGKYYYHPVETAFRCMELINDYRLTKDVKYLDRAKVNFDTILSKALRYNKGIYFPYNFDYKVLQKDEVSYKQPWFSGMAQGMLLSTACRLYYLTRHKKYKAVADSILITLTDFSSPYSTVWVSENDGIGLGPDYYWVDEYPHPKRVYVLNGSIIGAMGLYDHWWVFGDKLSRKLLSQELTTIKNHVLLYRNPGTISSYDLRYREKHANYHQWHIDLMENCYEITNDRFFLDMKNLFYKDYHR